MTDWEGMWSRDGGLKPGVAFDAKVPLPALSSLIAEEGTLPEGRALVPGMGRGYAALALASEKRTVVGLDLAPTAVAAAEAHLAGLPEAEKPPAGSVSYVAGDFFKDAPKMGPFDMAYDYTFLCALPPSLRESWADTYAQAIRPGGKLVTGIFPIGDHAGGPPYAVNEQLYTDLLVPRGFKAEKLERLPDNMCHAGREGKTAIGVWVKSDAKKDDL